MPEKAPKILPKKAVTKKGQRKGQKTSNRKCKTCKSSPISAIKSSFPNNSDKKGTLKSTISNSEPICPRQLAIRSKDVRDDRRGSDKSSELKRLATARVAAETAASGLAGTAAGSAAAALVGEGDNYGEDEA